MFESNYARAHILETTISRGVGKCRGSGLGLRLQARIQHKMLHTGPDNRCKEWAKALFLHSW